MQIRLQLSLPRDARYVGTLRAVTACMLEDVNAPQPAADDVQLALSEACNNVVRHATGSDEYSVSLVMGEHGCEIEVVDLGPGFQPPNPEDLEAPLVSEEGRGLLLMHALVDRLEFVGQRDGTRLRLRKHWNGLRLPSEDGSAASENLASRVPPQLNPP